MQISFVDFILYEMLDQHLLFDASCLDDFKNLNSFVDRFRSLERISDYMKSDRFLSNPLNNKMAKFGNV